MDIGFIGVGKLGGPVSIATAMKGHTLYVYDVNPKTAQRVQLNSREPNLLEQYNEVKERYHVCEFLDDVIKNSEIIIVCVQTPHPKELDGSIRSYGFRMGFDNSYLVDALKNVAESIKKCDDGKYRVVEIISTVLPGTTRDILFPLMKQILGEPGTIWDLIYGAAFPAMSTVVEDWLNQEFKLIGNTSDKAAKIIEKLYTSLSDCPKLRMTYVEAECVKQFYNTFIGFKILCTNSMLEIAHKIGDCDAQVVMDAIKCAGNRICSSKYLNPGLGDGGPCHSRDAGALAYLADSLRLSTNPFGYMQIAREKQTEFIAKLMYANRPCDDSPYMILGTAYKPNIDLSDGSCSLLVKDFLDSRGLMVYKYDVYGDKDPIPQVKTVYLLGCPAKEYYEWPFKEGDVVIDPWNFFQQLPKGIKLVKVGNTRGKEGDNSVDNLVWSRNDM